MQTFIAIDGNLYKYSNKSGYYEPVVTEIPVNASDADELNKQIQYVRDLKQSKQTEEDK